MITDVNSRQKDRTIADHFDDYHERRRWNVGATRNGHTHYERIRDDGDALDGYAIEGEWPKYGVDPMEFTRLLKRVTDEAIVVTGWHDIGGAHRYEIDGVGAFADCPMVALRDAVYGWLQQEETDE